MAGMSCIFAFCGVFGVKVSGKYSFLLWPLAAVVFSAFDIALVQIANEYGPILPVMQYLIGIEVSVAIMLLFFCIYVWLFRHWCANWQKLEFPIGRPISSMKRLRR